MQIQRFKAGPLGANCFLVTDTDSKTGFIVDPGGESGSLFRAADASGCAITHLILTHGHPDHLCGIDVFLEHFPGIEVVAHEDEQPMLEDVKINRSPMYCRREVTVRADRFVSDFDTLRIGGMELLFLHTPGHTPGGMCILVDGHLFSGDTLFRDSIGRTDFPYGSYPALRDAIREKLFTLPPETIVHPGHESDTTIGHEKEYNPFV